MCFRQHYYPEGGWGWVVVFCSLVVQILRYRLLVLQLTHLQVNSTQVQVLHST